jgi:hypothetical protein
VFVKYIGVSYKIFLVSKNNGAHSNCKIPFLTLATHSNAIAEQAGAAPRDVSIQPVCALRVDITLLPGQQAAVLQLFPGLDPGPEIFIAGLG